MRPELHRPVVAGDIPPAGQEVLVVASAAECAALAARMRLPEVRSLRCRFRLSRPERAGSVEADGWLEAQVVQTCVVTLEDFVALVTEDFAVRFVPAGTEAEEVDPEAVDEIGYSGGVLDLGEAAAEQLALALDPYPRAPGAMLGQEPEHDNTSDRPFAALARWHRPH